MTQATIVPKFPVYNGGLGRPIRACLCGGGLTKKGEMSFIGQHHIDALNYRRRGKLVAIAPSDDSPQWVRGMAPFYQVNEDRCYESAEAMIAAEAKKGPDERPDLVIIATPNFRHHAIAKAALEAGFHVVCEKPITMTAGEARELAKLVKEKRLVFAVPHGYAFFPTAILAGEIIKGGELGEVLAARGQYIQGWLADQLEAKTVANAAPAEVCDQAVWRTDPQLTGKGGSTGDIMTHVWNWIIRASGVQPIRLVSVLRSFVPDRKVDDYGTAIIECQKGVVVTLTSSQVSVGRRNDLLVEIDCRNGSLIWDLRRPNDLVVCRKGQPEITYYSGSGADPAKYPRYAAACSWPGGHPEGLDNAWAMLYGPVIDDIVRAAAEEPFDPFDTLYPNVIDGVRGMELIEACVESDGNWIGVGGLPPR